MRDDDNTRWDLPESKEDQEEMEALSCTPETTGSVATHEMLQAAINKGIELRWLPHYCQHDRHMKDWAMMEECLNAALSKQANT